MITLTENAKEHIKNSVKKGSGEHFRLWVKSTGCSGYMYMPEVVSEPKSGDVQVDEFDGIRVYLDPSAADLVRGTEVDYIEKMLGFKQMVFNNPNATGLCGCGESFKLNSESSDE